MSSTPNTKSLQAVCDTDDGSYKLGHSAYYKYRAANLMFGFNTGFTKELASFAEFNALRKNQLLGFYEQLAPMLRECVRARARQHSDFLLGFDPDRPAVCAAPRHACADDHAYAHIVYMYHICETRARMRT